MAQITNILEKLKQVDKLMESKGFVRLEPIAKSLEQIANVWGSLYWEDFVYTKSYGKENQHTLFISLNTTDKLYRVKGKLYAPHIDISRARFHTGDNVVLNGKEEEIKNDLKELNKVHVYIVEAASDYSSLKKALNKISAYTNYDE